MSEGDFEVMPVGTTKELKMLRRFAQDMIILSSIHDMPVPHEMREKIDNMKRHYSVHVETYPV
jgi:hypothetical protein